MGGGFDPLVVLPLVVGGVLGRLPPWGGPMGVRNVPGDRQEPLERRNGDTGGLVLEESGHAERVRLVDGGENRAGWHAVFVGCGRDDHV